MAGSDFIVAEEARDPAENSSERLAGAYSLKDGISMLPVLEQYFI